jgi:hypothetical protein
VAEKLAAGIGGNFRTLCIHQKTSFQVSNDIDQVERNIVNPLAAFDRDANELYFFCER